MKVLLHLLILSVCLFVTTINTSAEEKADEWLLYFDKEADLDRFLESHGQGVISIEKQIVKGSFTEYEIQTIQQEGFVSLVEKNYSKTAALELRLSDPLVVDQWGLDKVNAEDSMANYFTARDNLMIGNEIITPEGTITYNNQSLEQTEFTIVLGNEAISRLSIELEHVEDIWQLEVFNSSGERIAMNEGNLQTLDVLIPRDDAFDSIKVMVQTKGVWKKKPVINNIIGVNHLLIAVIDSGVSQHEDYCGNVLYSLGKNYTSDDEYVDDEYGHGTHVTGILAACSDNEVGVTGILANAPVDILPLKVLDKYGNGSDYELGVAVDDAVQLDVDLINLSLAGKGETKMLREAIEQAIQQNIVVVAAAGNWKTATDKIYPASYPGVITVSGTTPFNRIISIANYGWEVDISAPGSDILSTYKDNSYKTLSGTSMSVPYISGAVAYMKLDNNQLDVLQIRSKLLATARDLNIDGYDIYSGAGLLQLTKAVQEETTEVIEWLTLKDGQTLIEDEMNILGLSNGLIGSDIHIFVDGQLYSSEKAESNRLVIDFSNIDAFQSDLTLSVVGMSEQRVHATDQIKVLMSNSEEEEHEFSDVADDFWAYDYIYESQELGFVHGYADGTFRGNNEITRRHSVMVLGRLFNWELPASIEMTFQDVPIELSGSLAIYSAADKGIIKGYSNGSFYPEEELTRGQIAVILHRALQKNDHMNSPNHYQFNDLEEDHYAYNAVQYLTSIGIVSEQPIFRPEEKITRAQFVAMLMRTYEHLQK
ncbi:S8 family peptidase [Cytobacillus sp. IB215316]|uniref:S8 family peptidase n=1 Tax=Cytobacillus sp. IB215316 TaxID=3097354 RepID=UPI002A16D21D|nr:S8 family serine peptidase [Cytobacillus sp. IB215316]MDX8361174.1 S8 family serine peptidase [Cytobacillus sp. IB215316]